MADPRTATRARDDDEDGLEPLTREQVLELVAMMEARRQYRLKAIARRFNRSVTTVRRIYARWCER